MKLQVIGDPVLHSKSPVIHGAMLAALGREDITYTARVVRRGELPDYLAWAKENGVTGFNATMPHKEDLVPLMDELDAAARASAQATARAAPPAPSRVTVRRPGLKRSSHSRAARKPGPSVLCPYNFPSRRQTVFTEPMARAALSSSSIRGIRSSLWGMVALKPITPFSLAQPR